MKKNLALIFCALFIFAGCSKKNEQFTMLYSFEAGKSYSYKLTQISIDNQEMKSDSVMKQSVKQDIVYLMDVKPAQKYEDGTLELSVNVKSINLNAEANGQKYSFESSANNDKAVKTQFAEYESLVNNPFSIRLSKIGEIIEIFKADNISNKYIDLKGYSDSVNTEQRTMIRNNMIQAALKPLLIQIFRQVPAHPVAIDSNWNFMQPPTRFMTFNLQNSNIYKIDSLNEMNKDQVAVINAGMNTSVTGDSTATDRGVSYAFTKPVTKAEGKIYFNVSKGYIIKSTTKTKVNIFYTMEAPGPKGTQKMERRETVENINTVEMI